MSTPLEETLQRARARCADPPEDHLATEELETTEYQLRLLRLMRSQLPATDHEASVSFIGPTELVLDLVRGTTRFDPECGPSR